MTIRSANRPMAVLLTSVLWMSGFLFVASALCGAHAEAETFGYVANPLDNTIAVISTNDNTVVATIPVGSFPCGVATTPDGTHAYVANQADGTVSVIATAKNTVVATIRVGAGPTGVAITPDGTRAYVANEVDGTVSVIATARNTVVATVLVGAFPTGVATTPLGTHSAMHDDHRHQSLVYVTNQLNSSNVSAIDIASNAVVATIPVGADPSGVAITPDGTHAYVANFDNTVSVIDTDSNAVVATIPAGLGPTGVAITPDGTHAYVTNQNENTVSVIDTDSNTVVATIPVGQFPSAVAIPSEATHPFEHDGRRRKPLAYVTNPLDNTVSVIDTDSNNVVATIPVGHFPFALAFATVTRQRPD